MVKARPAEVRVTVPWSAVMLGTTMSEWGVRRSSSSAAARPLAEDDRGLGEGAQRTLNKKCASVLTDRYPASAMASRPACAPSSSPISADELRGHAPPRGSGSRGTDELREALGQVAPLAVQPGDREPLGRAELGDVDRPDPAPDGIRRRHVPTRLTRSPRWSARNGAEQLAVGPCVGELERVGEAVELCDQPVDGDHVALGERLVEREVASLQHQVEGVRLRGVALDLGHSAARSSLVARAQVTVRRHSRLNATASGSRERRASSTAAGAHLSARSPSLTKKQARASDAFVRASTARRSGDPSVVPGPSNPSRLVEAVDRPLELHDRAVVPAGACQARLADRLLVAQRRPGEKIPQSGLVGGQVAVPIGVERRT